MIYENPGTGFQQIEQHVDFTGANNRQVQPSYDLLPAGDPNGIDDDTWVHPVPNDDGSRFLIWENIGDAEYRMVFYDTSVITGETYDAVNEPDDARGMTVKFVTTDDENSGLKKKLRDPAKVALDSETSNLNYVDLFYAQWSGDEIICQFNVRDPAHSSVKTLTSGNNMPNEGDVVTFQIEVTNNGTLPATDVSISDILPTGTTATANNGTTSQGTYNTTTGRWNIGNLSGGASATLTLEGTVNVGQTIGPLYGPPVFTQVIAVYTYSTDDIEIEKFGVPANADFALGARPNISIDGTVAAWHEFDSATGERWVRVHKID